ncbi:hypothetical protein B0H19DRAFT_1257289 [Mycena capillaripes]|nr:hypothetical protein B0H19DRAFT_1257289 [Mycena capillaripes]
MSLAVRKMAPHLFPNDPTNKSKQTKDRRRKIAADTVAGVDAAAVSKDLSEAHASLKELKDAVAKLARELEELVEFAQKSGKNEVLEGVE